MMNTINYCDYFT